MLNLRQPYLLVSGASDIGLKADIGSRMRWDGMGWDECDGMKFDATASGR